MAALLHPLPRCWPPSLTKSPRPGTSSGADYGALDHGQNIQVLVIYVLVLVLVVLVLVLLLLVLVMMLVLVLVHVVLVPVVIVLTTHPT